MRIGSLFSGVGGLELGLERAGVGKTVWQCECDPFARSILARHWPGVPCFDDVREVGIGTPAIDVLCGGFPCTGISAAGKRRGFANVRSGLWFHFARLIRLLRPGYIVMENSPRLPNRGLGVILGTLATLGYDAWWDCIPASALGAHHERDRFFLVSWQAPNAYRQKIRVKPEWNQWQGWAVRTPIGGDAEPLDCGPIDGWDTRPGLARVGDGHASGMDRNRWRALGNAVVPQVAEVIGRVLLDIDRQLG